MQYKSPFPQQSNPYMDVGLMKYLTNTKATVNNFMHFLCHCIKENFDKKFRKILTKVFGFIH